MAWVADDLGAWLIGVLADGVRRRVVTWALGTDQERALQQAAHVAVQLTAAELCPEGGERAEHLAMVINQVFTAPVPDVVIAEPGTLLQTLQAGIEAQLAPLDDPTLTGAGESSADLLGVRATVLARKLAGHLVREIILRGARGGPLEPFAAQLNHDITHLQNQRLEGMLGQMVGSIRNTIAELGHSAPVSDRQETRAGRDAYVAGVNQTIIYNTIPVGAKQSTTTGSMQTWMAAVGPVVVGDIPQRPPCFQPRPDLLAALEQPGARVSVVHAVTGMRGVGKTQLAAAYTRARLADGWRLVAWVNAEDPASTAAGLTAVADALGLVDDEASQGPSENFGPLVRRWLETDGDRCLLVFDNAADADALRPLIPAGGAARVLITSNRRSMANLGTSVSVEAFKPEEAVAFLTERTGLSDPAGAAAVAAELGYLPLALSQAAAVIAGQYLAYRTYLDRLRALRVDEYLIPEHGQPYPRGVAETVLLSLNAVHTSQHGDVCARVMEVMAVLSPTGVYRDLLYDAGQTGSLSSDSVVLPETLVDEALGRLAERSLLAFGRSRETVTVHRLVMRVIRDGLARRGRLASVCRTVASVLDARAGALKGSLDHPAIRDTCDQVMALWANANDSSCASDGQLVRLLLGLRLWVLYFLNELGDSTREAIAIGEELIADLERVLGADHPDTLSSRNNLADAYRGEARSAEAIALYEKNLAACQRQMGLGHPTTMKARNNLAIVYQEAGRYTEAIPLLEQNLATYERLLGPDHPSAVAARNDLAAARRDPRTIE